MPSADDIESGQRATWGGLAVGWEKWDQVIMDQLGPVSAAMIDQLQITSAQQHLDVAAGTGEPGLSIARRAPQGRARDVVARSVLGDDERARLARPGGAQPS